MCPENLHHYLLGLTYDISSAPGIDPNLLSKKISWAMQPDAPFSMVEPAVILYLTRQPSSLVDRN